MEGVDEVDEDSDSTVVAFEVGHVADGDSPGDFIVQVEIGIGNAVEDRRRTR